jgi:hypothetical protein
MGIVALSRCSSRAVLIIRAPSGSCFRFWRLKQRIRVQGYRPQILKMSLMMGRGGGVEHPAMVNGSDQVASLRAATADHVAQERVRLMVEIPEASPPSCRSKRRADDADQANLERAEKLKTTRNLDRLLVKVIIRLPIPCCILLKSISWIILNQ